MCTFAVKPCMRNEIISKRNQISVPLDEIEILRQDITYYTRFAYKIV